MGVVSHSPGPVFLVLRLDAGGESLRGSNLLGQYRFGLGPSDPRFSVSSYLGVDGSPSGHDSPDRDPV